MKKTWNNDTLIWLFPSKSTWRFPEFSFSLILVLLVAMNVFPQNRYLQCTADWNYWYYQHLHSTCWKTQKYLIVTSNGSPKVGGGINPFLGNFPILYSLKTPGKQIPYGVFREYKIGKLASCNS